MQTMDEFNTLHAPALHGSTGPTTAHADLAARPPRPRPNGPRRLDSDSLFAGAVEIEIEHQDQVYRLRKTSLGKLILTK
jgi:hemin uptake protein HemP